MTTPRPRKNARQAAQDNAPWRPAPWELADASAIQALARGDANKDQQTRALRWLIEAACATYDLSFRPGDTSRETDFAEGRRFVGLQVVKLLKINLSELRRQENA